MISRRIWSASLTILVASAPAFAQPAPAPTPPPAPEPTPAPATPAPAPAPEPTPPAPAAPAAPETPALVEAPKPAEKKPDLVPIQSKWEVSFYGFVQMNSILDSTQGLNEQLSNSTIARPNTYAGDHSQLLFSARHSRFGFKIAAPDYEQIKGTAQLEMDFLGNQPPGISEASLIQNPALRFRHMFFKAATPYVDLIAGQTWQLFGWQGLFHPNTIDIQGVPGEIYSRAPQFRISKVVKTSDVDVEFGVAASRPPERASATPDLQAGIKVTSTKWKAVHTPGATAAAVDGASIGVSVVGRHFAVNNFAPVSTHQVTTSGYGISLDALIPIIPGTKEKKEGALTLTASFVNGAGIADLYSGLSGGVGEPALPNPAMVTPAPTFTPNVDNALALFFAADQTLHPVQWTSFIVGLQHYMPHHLLLSANYSHMHSGNAHLFGNATKVWETSNWADGNLTYDLTPAIRFGGEFSWLRETFVDGVEATNYRGDFAAFFLF